MNIVREITSLDELKQIELEIMKKIHEFCVETKITYYLAYGTLIGAIRHKGFIPWDDDIDILMKREDYNRFLDLFPKWCKDKNLSIANPWTKPYYGRPMTKVYDNRTILIEPEFKCDDPYGVFVDVWVLDGVADKKKRASWLKKMRRKKEILFASCYRMNKKLGFKKNFFILLAKVLNPKKQAIKFDEKSKTYPFEYSDNVMCYLTMLNKTESYKKECFSDVLLLDFEDTQFYAPVGYDSLLRSHYGDYMQLPPEEERKPRHVINTYWKE